jgi:hypothetical protein
MNASVPENKTCVNDLKHDGDDDDDDGDDD